MKKKFPQQVFVAGIGTGVGKTLVSATLVESLKADYWKPVQCGNLKESDTKMVRSLVSNESSKFHSERYRLKLAASPHFAAKHENVPIDLNQIQKPVTDNRLVMEGAGGLMVPLNEEQSVVDLIAFLQAPVILVARNYLGSINHTLLSIALLKSKSIELLGIIYSGTDFNDNEEVIGKFSNVATIGRITESKEANANFVLREADKLHSSLCSIFEL